MVLLLLQLLVLLLVLLVLLFCCCFCYYCWCYCSACSCYYFVAGATVRTVGAIILLLVLVLLLVLSFCYWCFSSTGLGFEAVVATCILLSLNFFLNMFSFANFSFKYLFTLLNLSSTKWFLKLASLFVFRTTQWMSRKQFLIPLMMIQQKLRIKIVHPYKVSHDQDISSKLHNKKKKNYLNPSMILTPMKTMIVIIEPIRRKCGSLRINERSILLQQFFQSVLDPILVCLYLYVAWFLCLLYVLL